MAVNSFVNTRKVAFKILDSFLNEIEVISGFNTTWAAEFGKVPKIGDTILVRKPYRWTVTNGAARVPQALDDQFATITVDRHKQISFDYSKWDETLNVDRIYERCFETQVLQMANQADDDACQFGYQNTNNIQGKLGTDPASLAEAQQQMLYAMAKLKQLGAMSVKRIRAILSPMQSATMQSLINQQFNNQRILGEQFATGKLQDAFGFERIRTDQNIYPHTAGTFTGTPLVNGASVEGATQLVTDGWTAADTLKAGDVISVSGSKLVNPFNRRGMGTYGYLLVLADALADSGGNMTIQVSVGGTDPLRGPGQYQNLDVLPADNSAITVWPGTTTPSGLTGIQGLAFGENAFAWVPITFPDPSKEGAWGSTVRDPKTGVSLSLCKQFQIDPYSTAARMDMGYGLAPLFPGNEAIRIVAANT